MTFIIPPAPADSLKILQDNIWFLPDQPTATRHKGPLTAAGPYPIYNDSRTAVLKDEFLKAPELTGWVYVISSGESPRALAELAVHGKELSYSALYPKDYADALVEAIREAERRVESDHDWQFAILRIPSLGFKAIWLHDRGEDLLVPVRPTPTTLKRDNTMSSAAVVDALRGIAKRRMATPDQEPSPREASTPEIEKQKRWR